MKILLFLSIWIAVIAILLPDVDAMPQMYPSAQSYYYHGLPSYYVQRLPVATSFRTTHHGSDPIHNPPLMYNY